TRNFVAVPLCALSSLLVAAAFARRRHQYAGLLLLSSFFFAGVLLSTIERQAMPVNSLKQLLENGCVDDRQSLSLTGVIDQPPELSRDRVYLLLRLEQISSGTFEGHVNGTVSLARMFKTATERLSYQDLNLQYGTRVRVKANLNRTDQFRNPGVSTFTEYLDR